MLFPITALPRPVANIDWSDITDATQTGEAMWVGNEHATTGLEIPFDRDLTSSEVAAITLRLATASDAEVDVLRQVEAYELNPAPSAADNAEHLLALARGFRALFAYQRGV